jgi:hypothetical protein
MESNGKMPVRIFIDFDLGKWSFFGIISAEVVHDGLLCRIRWRGDAVQGSGCWP